MSSCVPVYVYAHVCGKNRFSFLCDVLVIFIYTNNSLVTSCWSFLGLHFLMFITYIQKSNIYAVNMQVDLIIAVLIYI